MFIQSLCCISPSGVITDSLQTLQEVQAERMYCMEPDYKALIPPMQLRRMSKTIRTGVAAAKMCLDKAGLEKPDAIHIGTAYGVLDDSEKFLNSIIVHNEQTLTPTAFIQSTHNTVSGQIALAVSCTAHNLTFVNKAHSFENALLDAGLFLQRHKHANVLAGAVDECTDTGYDILKRFGIYNNNIPAGEGASFFILSKEQTAHTVAAIKAFDTFRLRADDDIHAQLQSFIGSHSLQIKGDDTVVWGAHGPNDAYYTLLQEKLFPGIQPHCFKQYCGEYPTASAFGLAYTALQLKAGTAKQAWLVNNYGTYWSIYCLSK